MIFLVTQSQEWMAGSCIQQRDEPTNTALLVTVVEEPNPEWALVVSIRTV